VDVVFLATPHEASREWVPALLERNIRVIDLSAAWGATYKFEDADPALAATLQRQAVYGCPELHRALIAGARVVAIPGCYATSTILALAPLLRAGVIDLNHGIVAEAKAGVSERGKAMTTNAQFMYAADGGFLCQEAVRC
jgi:N-acetyl-gamma-glutamyl-phosphate reductase